MKIDINDIDTSIIVIVNQVHLYNMGNPEFINIYNKYGYGYLMKSNEYLRDTNSIRIAVPEPFNNDDIRYNFRKYVNDFNSSNCSVSYKNSDKFKKMPVNTRINKFCLHYKSLGCYE